MNIHEHQAKELLRKYGVPVPKGVFALSVKEIIDNAKKINTEKSDHHDRAMRSAPILVCLWVFRHLISKFGRAKKAN